MKVLCKGKEKTMAKNKMGMKMHERIYQGILWILLIVIALTMILPFLYVVILHSQMPPLTRQEI